MRCVSRRGLGETWGYRLLKKALIGMHARPEHKHVLEHHFSRNEFQIDVFSMFGHLPHQEPAEKVPSMYHMKVATESSRLALSLHQTYSSKILHSSWAPSPTLQCNGQIRCRMAWSPMCLSLLCILGALLNPSKSLSKTAECSSQVLSYWWRSWDALSTIACSASVSFFGPGMIVKD